jgi:hypothetical protein
LSPIDTFSGGDIVNVVEVPSTSAALAITTFLSLFSEVVLATEEKRIAIVEDVAGIDTTDVMYVEDVGVAVTPAEIQVDPLSKL